MILVSVYPVMTAVNIDHNMNVQDLVAGSHNAHMLEST